MPHNSPASEAPDASVVTRRFVPEAGAELVAAAALALAVAAALLRPFEYDEAYSIFLTHGVARPPWPEGVFTKADIADYFERPGPLGGIAEDLRRTDVHPPLYFWALGLWRHVVEGGFVEARLFSVLATAAMLAGLWRLVRLAEAPPMAGFAIPALAFATVHSGATARGYALALALLVWGTWFLCRDVARGGGAARILPALAGGALLGAAILTGFLAALPAAGAIGVFGLMALQRGRWAPALAAPLGAAPFVAYAATFHLAQDRRDWQFPSFDFDAALFRSAEMTAAAFFGATPLHFGQVGRLAATAAIAAVMLAVGLVALWRAPALLSHPVRRILLGAGVAVPLGLILLGVLHARIPIEYRYLGFAVPFLGIVAACALRDLASRAPRSAQALLGSVLALQLAGIAALPFSEATRQLTRPAMAAATREATPEAIILVPNGADGVGLVGALLGEAPEHRPLRLLRPGEAPRLLKDVADAQRLVLVRLADGTGEQAIEEARSTLEAAGWTSRTPGLHGGTAGRRASAPDATDRRKPEEEDLAEVLLPPAR
ncbi:glycosyltransferase family 39 protein [Falsiroseomonas oryziterrae]|uniref:glycosyltransferase family 39 protein n=1 Tax=Falsiroseomonas oryziterrae TaxID=2911368 RepID=UPI001F439433|nr:glycosyltransferase family 39 protein [Roseomonas sp. NPKOSM-4]